MDSAEMYLIIIEIERAPEDPDVAITSLTLRLSKSIGTGGAPLISSLDVCDKWVRRAMFEALWRHNRSDYASATWLTFRVPLHVTVSPGTPALV